MSIFFSNPGKIDLRCITTMGVNVKADGSNPIGYFGTGLKYALAVCLRHDLAVTIWIGDKTYNVVKSKDSIRGKEFEFISLYCLQSLTTTDLPFTTELGKNWSLENAYRELWSNCMDEKGTVSNRNPAITDDSTTIMVQGEAFDYVHANRDSFILSSDLSPIFKHAIGEIYPFSSSRVFYKGIAAFKLPRPSAYTYNITKQMDLTEDRTLYSWTVERAVEDIIIQSNHKGIIKTALVGEDQWEKRLDFAYAYKNDDFLGHLSGLVKASSGNMGAELVKVFYATTAAVPEYIECELSDDDRASLKWAITKCKTCGFPVDMYPIKVSNFIGEGFDGLAADGKIWLHSRIFSDKTYLIAVLLEEYCHLRYEVKDETRAMQNRVFTMLASLVEEKGEE
jgi:hypothetical protein